MLFKSNSTLKPDELSPLHSVVCKVKMPSCLLGSLFLTSSLQCRGYNSRFSRKPSLNFSVTCIIWGTDKKFVHCLLQCANPYEYIFLLVLGLMLATLFSKFYIQLSDIQYPCLKNAFTQPTLLYVSLVFTEIISVFLLLLDRLLRQY